MEKHSSHSLQPPPPPSSRYLGATWNPRQAPVALTPYGLRKILPETIKGCFFCFCLTTHRFHLINFPDVCAHSVAVQSRGYAANENVSGDGSFAEWPFVWKQPLCSAGNARRLSIISTGSLLCCEPRRESERGACGLTYGVRKKIQFRRYEQLLVG